MPFDTPQTGSLAPYATPDPMRRIIAGLRRSAQPGTINQVGDEMSFYGQGDPLDIAIAEEERRTERARADQRQAMSDASWVDPRLERDDPAAAAKIRQGGADLTARMQPIEDGPLSMLLNTGRTTARTLPMTRGAERVEKTADANAEALNYQSPAQSGFRDAQRWDATLNAKNEANTFMNPVVRQGRMAARAEGMDPQTAGMQALLDFIKGQSQAPYPGVGVADLISMFQLPLNTPAPEDGGGTPGVTIPGRAPGAAMGGKTISMAEAIAEARQAGKDPNAYLKLLRDDGFTITR